MRIGQAYTRFIKLYVHTYGVKDLKPYAYQKWVLRQATCLPSEF